MDTDKDADEPQGSDARERWRLEKLIPTLAVVAVTVTAVITAVMVSRSGTPSAQPPADVIRQGVVTAPPLMLAPPAAADAPVQGGSSPAASKSASTPASAPAQSGSSDPSSVKSASAAPS